MDTSVHRGIFLSSVTASRRDYQLAWTLVLVSLPIFVIVSPFATVKLPELWAFIPSVQSMLAANGMTIMLMLYAQFFVLRSPALLLLAAGYQFSALMSVTYALTFPRLFAPTGLLAAGPQTTAWLYIIWHAGFPLAVIGYTLLRGRGPIRRAAWAIVAASIGTLAVVCAATSLAIVGHALLPAIMSGDNELPFLYVVVGIVLSTSLLSLMVLWRRRPHSVLDVWLMVVMSAWLLEVCLACLLNAGRFDVGWYMGRVYALLSASTVLVVLLIESGAVYARMARSYETENRELRAVQDRLEAKNEEMEAFSHSVSHDLRTPLRAIEGFSRILLEDHADRLDTEGRRVLNVVCDGAHKMSQMIDDILAFSRIGCIAMEATSVDMQAEVRKAINDLAAATDARQVDFDIGDLPRAYGDAAMLQQVWANLLGNAVKYTAPRERAVIQIGAEVRDGETVYSVRDNGVGFDMRYIDKLFGTFQRLHGSEFSGTGVGLSIVKRIVTRHGGRVWAEGEVDKGTTVFFSLGGNMAAGTTADMTVTNVLNSAPSNTQVYDLSYA